MVDHETITKSRSEIAKGFKINIGRTGAKLDEVASETIIVAMAVGALMRMNGDEIRAVIETIVGAYRDVVTDIILEKFNGGVDANQETVNNRVDGHTGSDAQPRIG